MTECDRPLKWSDFVQSTSLTDEEYSYAKKMLQLLSLSGMKLGRVVLILERVLEFCKEARDR